MVGCLNPIKVKNKIFYDCILMRVVLAIFLFIILITFSTYYINSYEGFSQMGNIFYPQSLNLFDGDKRKLIVDVDTEMAKTHYDFDTFIYNVFMDYNNKNLVIVGPELFDLKDKYMDLVVYFNGAKLDITDKIKDSRFYVLKFNINNLEEVNKVKIDVGQNSKTLIVYKNNYKCGDRILITKQKNNKPRWIEDWVMHYTERYNVSNIVIFDNNSDNFDELKNRLSKFSHVTLIPYNFPFGMPKHFVTNFLEYSLMHIGLEQFCSDDTYIFNFDIDELLMVDPDHLNNVLKPGNIYYKVKMWWVPMTIDKNSDYSFKDFKLKRNSSKSVNESPKYIVNKKNTDKIGIHGASTKCKSLVDGAYYLHFKGISTSWKYDRLNMPNKEELATFIPIDNF